jgi:hypothetical protein
MNERCIALFLNMTRDMQDHLQRISVHPDARDRICTRAQPVKFFLLAKKR